MKTGLKLALILGFGATLLQFTAAAQPKPAAANTATNAPKLSPQEMKENMSYAIGMDIGRNLKRGGVDLDLDVLHTAMKQAVAGGTSKLTDQQIQEAIGNYRREAMAKRDEERHKMAGKNQQEGEAFLAENKTKPGVKTLEVKLPDGKTAEMQYKVITEGTGATPKTNDDRQGQLQGHADQRQGVRQLGQARQPAGQVPGQSRDPRLDRGAANDEGGLEMGDLHPASLAYGDNGYGPGIEPGSTLIFDMELVGIEAPPPPAAPPGSAAHQRHHPSALGRGTEEGRQDRSHQGRGPSEKSHQRRGPEAGEEVAARCGARVLKSPAPLPCPSRPGQWARPYAFARGWTSGPPRALSAATMATMPMPMLKT